MFQGERYEWWVRTPEKNVNVILKAEGEQVGYGKSEMSGGFEFQKKMWTYFDQNSDFFSNIHSSESG